MKPATNLTYPLLFAMAVAAAPCAAQPAGKGQSAEATTATVRGVYIGGTKLGVSAEIEVERGGERMILPSNAEFKTGDRFWLHLTVNQDSYIYVLNRTLTGSPAQVTRGVKLLAEDDQKAKRPPADSYTLVFPPPHAAAKLLKKGVRTSIPGPGQYFEMDQVSGAEKLMVVASTTPRDMAGLFNASNGKLSPAGKTNDTAGGVLGRLNSELSQMADNTETSEPPKSRELFFPGPGPGAKGPGQTAAKPPAPTIGVSRNPGKPMMLELTMVHQ